MNDQVNSPPEALSPLDFRALPQQPFVGSFPLFQDRPRRHRYEITLLILAIFFSSLAYLIALAIFFTMPDASSSGSTSILRGNLLSIALITLAFPWLVFIARGIMWGMMKVKAVEISPVQFPQAYEWLIEAAQLFQLKKLPKAYVLLGNGAINAFSSGHAFRRFVVLYSDLFEVSGKARDPEAVKFVLAHELGHIAAGHASWWRIVFTQSWSRIPILGPALSRAQEYTADNHGYAYCPQGAAKTTALLAGGKYLCRTVDPVQFVARAREKIGFFGWFANLIVDHPVNTWRAHALYYRSVQGGLFFRPRSKNLPPLLLGPEEIPSQLIFGARASRPVRLRGNPSLFAAAALGDALTESSTTQSATPVGKPVGSVTDNRGIYPKHSKTYRNANPGETRIISRPFNPASPTVHTPNIFPTPAYLPSPESQTPDQQYPPQSHNEDSEESKDNEAIEDNEGIDQNRHNEPEQQHGSEEN